MRKMLFACLLTMSLLLSVNAVADTISFNLTSSNLGAGYTGPFASVLVDRTSATTATITFNSLTDANYTYLMADGGSAAVNVNATSWTLGSISGTQPSTVYSDGGSGNEDGFGSFNQKINSFDGWKDRSTMIEFILTNTSGTWATAADVLAGNNLGNTAAIHAFAWDGVSDGATATGFASKGSPVPIPAAAWLLGTGLIGLVGIRRRFQK